MLADEQSRFFATFAAMFYSLTEASKHLKTTFSEVFGWSNAIYVATVLQSLFIMDATYTATFSTFFSTSPYCVDLST